MNTLHVPERRARSAGFTLVELLIASALSAIVLMASAHAAGMFATQLQDLTDEGDSELERALATIIHDVRYAWWAEVTGTSASIVAGPAGKETTYAYDDDRLTVTDTRGNTDVLAYGLESATFSAATMTRYREDDPVSASEAFWWSSAPVTAAVPLVLMEGDTLGLGFTVRSASPWDSSVEGIEEQLLSATLDQLELPLATLVSNGATLQIALHRARSPGDGRPEGPPLSTKLIRLNTLPLKAFTVFDVDKLLTLPTPLLPPLGRAPWWVDDHDLVFKTTAPTTDVPLSLWGAARAIEPGVSYTLLLSVIGDGAVVLRVHPLLTSVGSGLSLMSDLDKTGIPDMEHDAYTPIAYAVPCRLRGVVTATSTLATEVVTRIDVMLRDTSGLTARGSANLSGQTLAMHPWLGAIPGEAPVLTGAAP